MASWGFAEFVFHENAAGPASKRLRSEECWMATLSHGAPWSTMEHQVRGASSLRRGGGGAAADILASDALGIHC